MKNRINYILVKCSCGMIFRCDIDKVTFLCEKCAEKKDEKK